MNKTWIESLTGFKKWSGEEASFLCPFHDDHNPSCSVNAAKEVFRCHRCGEKGTLREFAKQLGVAYPSQQSTKHQKPVTSDGIQYEAQGKIYSQYQDETGKIVYKSVRHYPNGKKDFYTVPKGVKTFFPYRLPEVMKAIGEGKEIIIAEGEKDCETLRSIGFTATTNHGGTGMGWGKQHSKWFPEGTKVSICGDADKPGQKHVNAIAEALLERKCKVKILDLGYPIEEKRGKDITDWINEGHTKQDFEKLLQTAKDRKELEPSTQELEILTSGLTVRELDAKKFPPIKWIAKDVLPEGLGGVVIANGQKP